MSSPSGTKQQRTCVSCRKSNQKTRLHRFVRTSDGNVVFDVRGRAAGRGAYVCSKACLEEALKSKGFERALKMAINDETKERLWREASAVIAEDEEE